MLSDCCGICTSQLSVPMTKFLRQLKRRKVFLGGCGGVARGLTVSEVSIHSLLAFLPFGLL
jgi:hypothetical protein